MYVKQHQLVLIPGFYESITPDAGQCHFFGHLAATSCIIHAPLVLQRLDFL